MTPEEQAAVVVREQGVNLCMLPALEREQLTASIAAAIREAVEAERNRIAVMLDAHHDDLANTLAEYHARKANADHCRLIATRMHHAKQLADRVR